LVFIQSHWDSKAGDEMIFGQWRQFCAAGKCEGNKKKEK
jgi:hypothetical protein